MDNGSADDTWEIVRSMAAEDPGIVAWRRNDVPFHDGLRADIYHAFRDRAEPGDWWARVDPDEFYVDDPRSFLAQVPSRDGCVWYASLSYYFSSADAQRYQADPGRYADDVPVMEKCRYYVNHWSEIRFVRHEVMDPWAGREGWPEGLTRRVRSHRRRILCRHFSYRSPQQIERRIATRLPTALAGGAFSHELISDWGRTVDPRSVRRHRWRNLEYSDEATVQRGWESRVVDAGALEYDAHDGQFVLNPRLMPPLPGTWRGNVARLDRGFRRLAQKRR
jgi:hypothetical protein